MKTVFTAILFLVLSACQNQSLEQNQTKNRLKFEAVIGGENVNPQDELALSTVGIYDSEEQAICTGSLIAPNIVLTAAHCINPNATQMKIIFNVNLDNIIDSKNQLLVNFYQRNVTDAMINPSYKPEEHEDKEFNYGDIALIKFTGELPQGFKPAQMLKDISALKPGVEVTVAGYGVSEVYTDPINPKKYKNLQEAIEFGDVFCSDENNTKCVSVTMIGDGLLRTTKALISSLEETEFLLDESKGHGTCNGDSGGPAYIKVNDQFILTGVTSRGSWLCDDIGIYTDVVSYTQWINETIPLLK